MMFARGRFWLAPSGSGGDRLHPRIQVVVDLERQRAHQEARQNAGRAARDRER